MLRTIERHYFSITIFANQGSLIRNSTTYNNGDDGIQALQAALIQGCLSAFNGGDAIQVGAQSHVIQNEVFGSSGVGNAGIRVTGSGNRIEANHAANNNIGLAVTGTSNVIVKNSASGNSTNFSITGANNRIGAIVTAAGTISADPWANFSH